MAKLHIIESKPHRDKDFSTEIIEYNVQQDFVASIVILKEYLSTIKEERYFNHTIQIILKSNRTISLDLGGVSDTDSLDLSELIDDFIDKVFNNTENTLLEIESIKYKKRIILDGEEELIIN